MEKSPQSRWLWNWVHTRYLVIEKQRFGAHARPIMRSVVLAIFLAVSASAAAADDLGVTFATFADKFHKAAAGARLSESLVKQSCDANPSTKRAICTYKLGDFMMVMASAKGDDPITEITMICATNNATDNIRAATKCIVAWHVAIAATSPDRDLEERAAIVKTLLAGIDVGESITIKAEDRKFVLQKSIGLWFHIEADR